MWGEVIINQEECTENMSFVAVHRVNMRWHFANPVDTKRNEKDDEVRRLLVDWSSVIPVVQFGFSLAWLVNINAFDKSFFQFIGKDSSASVCTEQYRRSQGSVG